MSWFKNIPVKRKLTLISTLTSAVALTITCGSIIVFELVSAHRAMQRDVQTIATMIGDNSAAALAFGDEDAANLTLRSLAADEHVAAAFIYDAKNEVFARYQPFGVPAISPPSPRKELRPPSDDIFEILKNPFADGYMDVFSPIKAGGEIIGTVYLRHSLEELRAGFFRLGFVVVCIMAAASAIAFILSGRLLAVVVEPIIELEDVIRTVASHKDFSVRAAKHGEDEVGRLIDGFNVMLGEIQSRDRELKSAQDELEARVAGRTQELKDASRKLLETSRRAGMAEVATSVLHNVGNVLNSVNVSCSVVADRLSRARIGSVSRTAELLSDHADDLPGFLTTHPTGKILPDFLAKIAEKLTADQTEALCELRLLAKNLDHIKEIVAMQQSYAKVSGVKETVEVAELVDDSLRMNEGSLSLRNVTVIREISPTPPIVVERHKALQIIVNLLRNAGHACVDSGVPDKRITVRVEPRDGAVAIAVIDNGIGIPAENVTRVFAHGFTTKPNGHGFGLHNGAVAAREMGGALTVESPGPGCGATFTLLLPVDAATAVSSELPLIET